MDKRHVGGAVRTLTHRINRAIDNIPAVKENENLTGIRIWILNFLFRHENTDVFQRDVEAEFGVSRATATVLLQSMEQDGIIRRVPVERDARLKKIVLTEEARELRRRLQTQLERVEKQLVKGFSEEELAAFFDYVDRFARNMEEFV